MVGRAGERALEVRDGPVEVAGLAIELAHEEMRFRVVGRAVEHAQPARARTCGIGGSQRLAEQAQRSGIVALLDARGVEHRDGVGMAAGANRRARRFERTERGVRRDVGVGRRGVAAVAVLVALAAAAGAGIVARARRREGPRSRAAASSSAAPTAATTLRPVAERTAAGTARASGTNASSCRRAPSASRARAGASSTAGARARPARWAVDVHTLTTRSSAATSAALPSKSLRSSSRRRLRAAGTAGIWSSPSLALQRVPGDAVAREQRRERASGHERRRLLACAGCPPTTGPTRSASRRAARAGRASTRRAPGRPHAGTEPRRRRHAERRRAAPAATSSGSRRRRAAVAPRATMSATPRAVASSVAMGAGARGR